MTMKMALLLAFATLVSALSIGCKSKCGTLSDTCAKCIDRDQQALCNSIVNAGNQDSCEQTNATLSGACR
jgi:hypothetical protein